MATKVVKEGGITTVYYFGTVWGCLLRGFISDSMGRVTGLHFGYL